jgi:sugar O-acyltransferase (sialic acid O-acetyltransferase NeuD family)
MVEYFVFGTGGFACEVVETIQQSVTFDTGEPLSGAVCIGRVGPTDALAERLACAPWLGDDAVLETLPRTARFVLGVGAPHLRSELWERAVALGFEPVPSCRHVSSAVSSSTVMSPGVVVGALVSITYGVELGAGVFVSPGAAVGHETIIGRYSIVNPNATVSGCVTIGEATMIGAQAVILERLSVGDGAVVGAGSVVTRNVPAGATVIGNPARVLA